MPDVARALWGEPNRKLSSKKELRWGTHGARVVNIAKGVWHDHESNEGGGVRDLLEREGHNPDEWLREHGFTFNGEKASAQKIVAVYDYIAENGELAYQVVRYAPKQFKQRRPDPSKPGEWLWNIKGVKPLPYLLPELIEAVAFDRRVFIPEGEKDVETLRRHGLDATCNSGGAGKWRPQFVNYLAGADVILLPDNDGAGRDHADNVAQSLNGKAARVRVLALPDLNEKGDVTDWFAAGGNVEAFNALVDAAPDWQPTTRPPEFSDAALAIAFAERHADTLRFVARWGHWMVFDGAVWREEQTLLAFDLARAICSETAERAKRKADSKSLASARTVAAVVTLARASRLLAATAEQWDAKHFLLTTG